MPEKSSDSSAILIKALSFRWSSDQPLLIDIDSLKVGRKERIFLSGPSGCGKSTLLSLITGMHRPTAGQIEILGQDLQQLGAAGRDRFRADHIGFIFQQFNLIPYLDLIDNVTLPLQFSSLRRKRVQATGARREAMRLLEALQLPVSELRGKGVRQLSMGQQQRVAAARALIGMPELIIADEPTSSLDADRQQQFLQLLFDQCQAQQSTLLLVSHDMRLASKFDRVLSLPDLNAAGRSMDRGVTC